MATFLQWKKLYDEGELKRLYFVYGPDRPLVEDVVEDVRRRVDPHDFDYVYLMAGEAKDKEIWAHVNQYPLDMDSRRLVVVRSAERLKSFEPLKVWLESRLMPQVHVILVLSVAEVKEEDWSKRHEGWKDIWHRIAATGRVVKCGPLNTAELQEMAQARFGLDKAVANYLVERLGGDLLEITNVGKMLSIFPVSRRTKALVHRFTEDRPAAEFVRDLVALKKPNALLALRKMGVEDYRTVIMILSRELDVARRVNKANVRSKQEYEIISELKLVAKAFKVKRLLPHAGHYNQERFVRCARALADADDMLQKGATTGVLEALVATW